MCVLCASSREQLTIHMATQRSFKIAIVNALIVYNIKQTQ